MEGPQIKTLTQNDKINAVVEKLELCKRNIKPNIFIMYPTFERWCPSNETEANKKIDHLGALQKQISLYFIEADVPKLNRLETHLKLTTSRV
jgi:hypothetical protein